MMQYAAVGDTVYFWFGANNTSGSGADGSTPVYDVRLGGAASNAAPVLSGSATLLSHANYPDGCHEVAVAATALNGFAAGNSYAVFCTLLVDSQNPTGFVGGFKLSPVVANVTQWSSSNVESPDVPGVPHVKVVYPGELITFAGDYGTGTLTVNITGDLSGSVGSVTGAVGSVTGGIGSLGAAAQANVRTAVGLASANLDTQLDALPTANENADALLGRNIAGGSSTGRTVSTALYALRNKVTISGGTMTVYTTDDTTISWTATTTSDAAADPITAMDPG